MLCELHVLCGPSATAELVLLTLVVAIVRCNTEQDD